MNKRLYNFFTNDHHRVEKLLKKAVADIQHIHEEYYHQFRTGLLTHIKMEEKILFRAAQEANGGSPLPLAAKLRSDHGALTALMAVKPDEHIVHVIQYVLDKHDQLEEAPGGMYEICEALTTQQTDLLLDRLKCTTPVPVHPVKLSPVILRAAKRALERAGFNYDEIIRGQK